LIASAKLGSFSDSTKFSVDYFVFGVFAHIIYLKNQRQSGYKRLGEGFLL
jgi:hypothetical protein